MEGQVHATLYRHTTQFFYQNPKLRENEKWVDEGGKTKNKPTLGAPVVLEGSPDCRGPAIVSISSPGSFLADTGGFVFRNNAYTKCAITPDFPQIVLTSNIMPFS